MTLLVQPRLANPPFGDAGLFLDFRFGGRAILFDLGGLTELSSRELLRVSHVFVSHMHMDHFSGFDHLLRLSLYRDKQIHLIGPPGLVEAVEAKLRAYTWNLLGAQSRDLVITVADWTEQGFEREACFRARRAFVREPAEVQAERCDDCLPLLVDEPEFHIEAVTLDHGIPCLAFAFQEKKRINVHKAKLDELGLPVGAWLTQAKRAARNGADLETLLHPSDEQKVSLGTLLREKALVIAQGQRIAYATDLGFQTANVERVCRLARGANQLFIEGGFLQEDEELAAAKKHLTAAQAGLIARQAGVRLAHQMHLSPRYSHREWMLRAEFGAAFAGAS